MQQQIKVLIDNGHGEDTPGKCSPDKRLREYKYCREIAQRVSRELSLRGVDALLLVPETTDTPLKERVRKANAWCNKLGSKMWCLCRYTTMPPAQTANGIPQPASPCSSVKMPRPIPNGLRRCLPTEHLKWDLWVTAPSPKKSIGFSRWP